MNQVALYKVIQKIYSLNLKLGGIGRWDADVKRFRLRCLSEELHEFANSETEEEELDAICDLIVFAYGTLFSMGYSINQTSQALNIIMAANLKKQIGANTPLPLNDPSSSSSR